LCPDIKFAKEHVYLQNGYDDEFERDSFEIMINKCSN